MQSVKCFLKAMFEWFMSGCRLVEYYTYWRRRLICRACSQGWVRCPICGCWLFAYCRLFTSHCANWLADPPKNGYQPTKD